MRVGELRSDGELQWGVRDLGCLNGVDDLIAWIILIYVLHRKSHIIVK